MHCGCPGGGQPQCILCILAVHVVQAERCGDSILCWSFESEGKLVRVRWSGQTGFQTWEDQPFKTHCSDGFSASGRKSIVANKFAWIRYRMKYNINKTSANITIYKLNNNTNIARKLLWILKWTPGVLYYIHKTEPIIAPSIHAQMMYSMSTSLTSHFLL